jgi:hypothetical protein
MLCVERDPSHLLAPGRDFVDQDPVDAFQAEAEEQDFQEAGVQEGTAVMERGL